MAKSVTSQRRLAALRYRDFRLIWLGEMVSTVGSQMQLVAIDWHVFQLLRGQTLTVSLFGATIDLSAGALGLGTLGLVRVIPIIFFALLGGLLADSRDRRKLMIVTRVAATVFALILAVTTLTGQVTIGTIYLLTAAGAAAAAFDSPARQSLVPNLVPREHLANAVSLNTLMWQLATIIGPPLTGLLIGGLSPDNAAPGDIAATAHIGIIYAINAASYLVAIIALLLIRYRGQVMTTTGIGWAALIEGLRFTYQSRIIWGTMLLDFFATFFASARTMLPIVATEVLHLGPAGYGLLATAQPVGAVLAGAIVALRKEIQAQGMVLLVSVGVYGLATAFFGLSTSLIISYVMFALTGAGDTVSTVIRGTLRQRMTPDYLRGRMTSVNMMFFMGGPQLGELEAGLVAAAFGVPLAIFTGGIATVLLTGWIAWKYPRLRNYVSSMSEDETLAPASL
jgi:MFS family permease